MWMFVVLLHSYDVTKYTVSIQAWTMKKKPYHRGFISLFKQQDEWCFFSLMQDSSSSSSFSDSDKEKKKKDKKKEDDEKKVK